MSDGKRLRQLFHRLLESYGPQHWWPAETPFEVMAGAVLTQNTSWKNVEQAIANLRRADCLSAQEIYRLEPQALAELIRPSGYFNVKAERLRNLCRWLERHGGVDKLQSIDTDSLRASLLGVRGIGPETADDILLYALGRPVFVIDTYTRRLLKKLDVIDGEEKYEQLRKRIETALGPDAALYNEYHALIVRHAKEKCRAVPPGSATDCRHCRVEGVAAAAPDAMETLS